MSIDDLSNEDFAATGGDFNSGDVFPYKTTANVPQASFPDYHLTDQIFGSANNAVSSYFGYQAVKQTAKAANQPVSRNPLSIGIIVIAGLGLVALLMFAKK